MPVMRLGSVVAPVAVPAVPLATAGPAVVMPLLLPGGCVGCVSV